MNVSLFNIHCHYFYTQSCLAYAQIYISVLSLPLLYNIWHHISYQTSGKCMDKVTLWRM